MAHLCAGDLAVGRFELTGVVTGEDGGEAGIDVVEEEHVEPMRAPVEEVGTPRLKVQQLADGA